MDTPNIDPMPRAGETLDLVPQSAAPDTNPFRAYLTRLSPGSRRTMAQTLGRIAAVLTGGSARPDSLPWGRLRYRHTVAIRSHLAATYAPSTANKGLAALRGVLKEAWRLGQIGSEDYRRAADVGPVRGETIPAGRALGAGEIRALFRTCAEDATPAGRRDAAMLGLLYGAGLRRSEVVALDVESLDLEAARAIVREAKGGKDRHAYLPEGAVRAVSAWLEVRGLEPGPAITPVRKGGRVEVRRMSADALYAACRRRAAQAGVAGFSPHDLRRTFIGDLLDAGADVAIVRKLAGHSNIQTTARYDRRPERARRRAADLLHVPCGA